MDRSQTPGAGWGARSSARGRIVVVLAAALLVVQAGSACGRRAPPAALEPYAYLTTVRAAAERAQVVGERARRRIVAARALDAAGDELDAGLSVPVAWLEVEECELLWRKMSCVARSIPDPERAQAARLGFERAGAALAKRSQLATAPAIDVRAVAAGDREVIAGWCRQAVATDEDTWRVLGC